MGNMISNFISEVCNKETSEFLTLIVSIMALSISLLSSHLNKQQNTSSIINYCNETYCRTLLNLDQARSKSCASQFEQEVYNLIRLYSYQVLLWQYNLLPVHILFTWSKHNCKQIQDLKMSEGNDSLSFKKIWNRQSTQDIFSDPGFHEYMDNVCRNDLKSLKHYFRSYGAKKLFRNFLFALPNSILTLIKPVLVFLLVGLLFYYINT